MPEPLQNIGISAVEYVLPEHRLMLEELQAAGRLDTEARRLREFGFEHVFVSKEPAETLASEAVRRLLASAAIAPESVDALFYAGAVPASHAVGDARENFLTGFNYPGCKLQYDFGLLNAAVTGISQVGCMGLATAVKSAADFLRANPATQRVLCVSADVFPPLAKREVIYNVVSDGACALLVEKDSVRNRILAYRQITKGYYWNNLTHKNEIVAAYFP